MSAILSRRKLITASLATATGVAGVSVAARIADGYGLLAPDHGGVFGVRRGAMIAVRLEVRHKRQSRGGDDREAL